jgi:hypothetical protein
MKILIRIGLAELSHKVYSLLLASAKLVTEVLGKPRAHGTQETNLRGSNS